MLRLPPPIWALIYVVAAAVASYLLGWPRLTGLPIVWLGVLLIVFGIALIASAVTLFRRAGAELDPASLTNRTLVVQGPYRFTRNPMYLGLTIVTIGIVCLVGSWPMILAPVALAATVNWIHIPFEEAKMRRQFGQSFDEYARRVRRWI
jgi:protein-S-isoprenylcysteine O-methyltransferase Ste14